MPFGAQALASGGVRFRLWAPRQSHVEISIEGYGRALSMAPMGDGWHELETDRAAAGSMYQFVIEGIRVPDPASRFQPRDVHGPSEVINPAAYAWRDAGWKGRPWHEAVLYELHIGAFTPQGTFLAAIDKLDHLARTGITAIELMPLADFAGNRNWGYDGVLLYAPESSYGRPEDLKELVDAAHERGLMVFLDVVYNHFGPDGNYLPLYAPQFFTSRHKTPWGDAVNYDGRSSAEVREFMIQNALYWLKEYHLDGLRLDAVHAIIDDSPKDLLAELAERVRTAFTDRPVHLILENEHNQASRLERRPGGSPRRYTAQWNDDVHHVLHVAATREESGYYADYGSDTNKLARALAEGFAFQGELMRYSGKRRGEPSAHLPPDAFVSFIQNHDQIGNRAFGERLGALAPPEAIRAIASVYLLLPQIPMLFMGEEWNASEPFPFFCHFDGELGEAVRKGRREEFARFPEFEDPVKRSRIPDPQAWETFVSAKLNWEKAGSASSAEWIEFYRRALDARRRHIIPQLATITGNAGRYEILGEGAIVVRWQLADSRVLTLAANLSKARVMNFPRSSGVKVWEQGERGADGTFGPWAVQWSIEGA
jgi:malto-oligosyltrehalose trehalohydrolase